MYVAESDNLILKIYRQLKRAQARLPTSSFDREEITKEIERTFRPDVDQDICPIMRFVFLWAPLLVIGVLSLYAEVVMVVVSFFHYGFYNAMHPDDPPIFQISAMGPALFFLGVCAFLIALIPFNFFVMPKLIAASQKRDEEKLDEAVRKAVEKNALATPAPAGLNGWDLVKVWATAKHEQFCFKFRVAEPIPAT